MLLGTLALSATPFVVGCSDDDDISRLEEQMATNQNTATVDKNELLNLINETKAALEEQLELLSRVRPTARRSSTCKPRLPLLPNSSTRLRRVLPSRLLRSSSKSTAW